MSSEHAQVVVIGAGLSGLSAGYALNQKGIDFIILEANDLIGGVVQTHQKDGYTYELGPNSMVATSPILSLLSELDLDDKLISASSESNRRYIIWAGMLHELAPSPKAILSTKLLSSGGKLAILKDFFIRKKWKEGETVDEFFTRHFGAEVAERIASALINGIYAGNAQELEMESVFPRLIEIEKEYGSVIKGMMQSAKKGNTKRTIISFNGGMKILIDQLAKDFVSRIELNAPVQNIRNGKDGGYVIDFKQTQITKSVTADYIINTAPASKFCAMFAQQDGLIQQMELKSISERLNAIQYHPMLTFHLGFPKAELKNRANGFGFLAPNKEEDEFIGVMWNSNTFEGKAAQEMALCTFFVRPKELEMPEEMAIKMLNEVCLPKFKSWTGISSYPSFVDFSFWPQAIPQKIVGHARLIKDVKKIELAFPGVYISGNYISGVSVGDCITYNRDLVNQIFSTESKS